MQCRLFTRNFRVVLLVTSHDKHAYWLRCFYYNHCARAVCPRINMQHQYQPPGSSGVVTNLSVAISLAGNSKLR